MPKSICLDPVHDDGYELWLELSRLNTANPFVCLCGHTRLVQDPAFRVGRRTRAPFNMRLFDRIRHVLLEDRGLGLSNSSALTKREAGNFYDACQYAKWEWAVHWVSLSHDFARFSAQGSLESIWNKVLLARSVLPLRHE